MLIRWAWPAQEHEWAQLIASELDAPEAQLTVRELSSEDRSLVVDIGWGLRWVAPIVLARKLASRVATSAHLAAGGTSTLFAHIEAGPRLQRLLNDGTRALVDEVTFSPNSLAPLFLADTDGATFAIEGHERGGGGGHGGGAASPSARQAEAQGFGTALLVSILLLTILLPTWYAWIRTRRYKSYLGVHAKDPACETTCFVKR
jgi:hypothetical protein